MEFDPTLVRKIFSRIREIKIIANTHLSTEICQVEIIPDYTGVRIGKSQFMCRPKQAIENA